MQRERGVIQYKNGFKLTLAPQRLNDPRKWLQPKRIFVNSMSDLFHEDVPLTYIRRVFEVMSSTPQHIYQVLTKRDERALSLASEIKWLDNIWLGVSIEDGNSMNRLRNLKAIPARNKFVSFEPLLEQLSNADLDGIDWVIVGGESGGKARPMNPDWVSQIKSECQLANVPFFFKQWGNKRANPDPNDPTTKRGHPYYAKGGCMINGKIFREIP